MVRRKPELTFEETKEEGFLMSMPRITLGEFSRKKGTKKKKWCDRH